MPLHKKILIALLLGLFLGIVANIFNWNPWVKDYIQPVGIAFIGLLKMIVVPLVFASLLVGTASLNDLRKLGRMASKAMIFYLCTTAIAISLGLLLANIFQPGSILESSQKSTVIKATGNRPLEEVVQPQSEPNIVNTLLNIIPENPLESLSKGNMLQIIFFALILGISLTLIPRKQSKPVIELMDGINQAMMKIVVLIMKLAPYGVFALMAAVFSEFGFEIIPSLFSYMMVVFLGLVIHASVIYSLALKVFVGYSLKKFFRGIKSAQIFAFSSSSSSATLPVTMRICQENLGVSKEVSSFVLPLGTTINMDGTALYQGVAAYFIAQVSGLTLTIGDQMTIVLTATLASIGTAGVPGVGLIMLILVLETIGLNESSISQGIALILGVDRLLDMCRTVVNVTGDCSCAILVNSTEENLKNNSNK